ncbi:MAG: PilX N-terminal domain-containing pilus assembly protein [Pseudomonadota bacterium]
MSKQIAQLKSAGLQIKQQAGVALFISLVLLLILTIIGVSAVQTTSLEVRMTRNEHDTLLAFQAAESALRDAEVQLEAIPSTVAFDDTNGLYQVAALGDEDVWKDVNVWTGANSVVAANDIDSTAEDPRYIIEYLGAVVREENQHQVEDPYSGGGNDRIEMFRITARGVGGTANSTVLLQTTYGRIMI